MRKIEMAKAIGLALIIGVAIIAGCGDATDRPQDCRADQYYNEAQQRCLVCPAMQEPVCRPGCGFEVVEDERGCAIAQCAAECEQCPDGETFSQITFQCVAEQNEVNEVI